MAKVSTKEKTETNATILSYYNGNGNNNSFVKPKEKNIDLSFQKTTFYNGECYCSRL